MRLGECCFESPSIVDPDGVDSMLVPVESCLCSWRRGRGNRGCGGREGGEVGYDPAVGKVEIVPEEGFEAVVPA